MRFAALGRTHWLLDAIAECTRRGHKCVLIATAAASPEYRACADDFARLARRLGCPFHDWSSTGPGISVGQVSNLPGTRKRAALAIPADVAISVNWPVLIAPQLLEHYPLGVVNAHAGDLPRYRGNAAPNWAILQGEREIAVVLHRMTPELDAGEILIERRLPLSPETYIGDVYRFLDAQIPAMFGELLDQIESGRVTGRQQPSDPARALRCYSRRPEDGRIDWTRPAEELARLVRAASRPFAGAYSYCDGEKLTIWRARADRPPLPCLGVPGQVTTIDRTSGEVAVLTGDGVLVLEEVGATDEASRPADVIRSTRQRLGVAVEDELVALRSKVSDLERLVQRLLDEKQGDLRVAGELRESY